MGIHRARACTGAKGVGRLRLCIGSAGLFIIGGLFAYFVAFRFGLTFLLGIGRGNYVIPMVSITEYFDLFVNVTLGVGLVFELPVIIFFLTLLRIVSPSFLLNHSRYAILVIFIIAAIVTPTPDVFNLMLFAMPMCLLFYVGIFAGYLLVLHRENRQIPLEEGHDYRYPRTADTSGRSIPGHYEIRYEIGTALALFDALNSVFL